MTYLRTGNPSLYISFCLTDAQVSASSIQTIIITKKFQTNCETQTCRILPRWTFAPGPVVQHWLERREPRQVPQASFTTPSTCGGNSLKENISVTSTLWSLTYLRHRHRPPGQLRN